MLVMRSGAFWFEHREPQALGRENDMRLTDPRTASGRDDETRRRDDAQATRQAVANRILKRDDSNAGSPALRPARGETGRIRVGLAAGLSTECESRPNRGGHHQNGQQ